MSELTWDAVHEHLVACRPEELQTAFADASEGERKGFGPRLLTYVRAEVVHDEWQWDGTARRHLPVLAVAAVACLPSDSAVGTLLNRAALRDEWDALPVGLMVAAAQDRGVPWLPALVPRLAERLPRDPWAQQWHAVAELTLATAAPVPTDERFVEGWVAWLAQVLNERPGEVPYRQQIRERILWGPFLDVLLPRVFEVDELGNLLGGDPDLLLLENLVALAAEGRLDRAALLDGCVARLHHQDRPGALRCFTTLHNRLEPTLAELTERTGDYADLAVITTSPVAGFAQEHLLSVQKARQLDLDLLLEISPPVLERPEQIVVRRQLKLLEQALHQHPDRGGQILLVVAGVFGRPVFDLQKRGLALVAKHAGSLGEAQRAELAVAAARLSSDLQPLAQEALGQSVGQEPLPDPVPTLPVDLPAPQREVFPPPVESSDELKALLRRAGRADWIADERTRAGLLTLSLADPVAVTRLLAEAMENLRQAEPWHGSGVFPLLLGGWPRDVRYFGNPGFARQQAAHEWIQQTTLHGEAPPGLGNWADIPHLVRQFRMSEVVAGLAVPRTATSPRGLLATPTDISGRIEPVVLLERIMAAETEGWQPYPLDLDQALLRLPRLVDPQIGVRAAALTSPAGGRLAAWLAGGGPAPPQVEVRGGRKATPGTYRAEDPRPGGLLYAVVTPSEPMRTDLQRALFTLETLHYPGRVATGHVPPPTDVFPDHREMIMAWALTDLESAREGFHGPLLPVGVDDGPAAGAATTLVLAYTFSADRTANRVAAVDGLLSLASAGNLDGTALGDCLGGMIADGPLLLPRVSPGLVETARAGATAATWDVVAALLPYVIGGKPAGLLPLLTLAVELATTLRRRDRIPGLDEVAARTGSGGVLTQARRLQRVLNGV